MKEELISVETSKLARKKLYREERCTCGGFPECLCEDKRTTQTLLQKWLREEHFIVVQPVNRVKRGWAVEVFAGVAPNLQGTIYSDSNEYFPSYEDALETGLQKALNYIKI